MSVCVQIIWRQVYEAHDMCMSVWTVSVSNSSHVGGCALCGQVESKECHFCETVNLHSCGWSFHLVEKNWLATYKSLTHRTASCPSFPLKQKSILCFTFIFLGYHSKEIPCHHCKYFRFIFCFPTFCLFVLFFSIILCENVTSHLPEVYFFHLLSCRKVSRHQVCQNIKSI